MKGNFRSYICYVSTCEELRTELEYKAGKISTKIQKAPKGNSKWTRAHSI